MSRLIRLIKTVNVSNRSCMAALLSHECFCWNLNFRTIPHGCWNVNSKVPHSHYSLIIAFHAVRRSRRGFSVILSGGGYGHQEHYKALTGAAPARLCFWPHKMPQTGVEHMGGRGSQDVILPKVQIYLCDPFQGRENWRNQNARRIDAVQTEKIGLYCVYFWEYHAVGRYISSWSFAQRNAADKNESFVPLKFCTKTKCLSFAVYSVPAVFIQRRGSRLPSSSLTSCLCAL